MHEKTVGEEIDGLVDSYTRLYDELKVDKLESIAEKARSLALHDLILGRYKYDRALERVRAYIDADEEEGGGDG